MRAALIAPDSTTVNVVEMPDTDQLTWLQGQVGGWIEHVTLRQFNADDAQIVVGLYINEEGKLANPPLPANPVATRLYLGADAQRELTVVPDYIAGPAVLTAADQLTGEEVDLPFDALDELRRLGFTVVQS